MSEAEPVMTQPLAGNDEQTQLPDGLKQLRQCREVTVCQHIDPVEVVLRCFARPCRYSVYSDQEEDQFLYVQEVSDCYARQIMGAARSFSLKFSDNNLVDVIRVVRPQTCSRGCCGLCCTLPTIQVQSPPGNTIATMTERRTCCFPVYDITDRDEETMFMLHPSCCYCGLAGLCSNIMIENFSTIINREGRNLIFSLHCDARTMYRIMENELSTKLKTQILDGRDNLAAQLFKQTKGSGKECIGQTNDFTIKYVQDLNVTQKAALLGAMFLVDFHYFERQNRCCC